MSAHTQDVSSSSLKQRVFWFVASPSFAMPKGSKTKVLRLMTRLGKPSAKRLGCLDSIQTNGYVELGMNYSGKVPSIWSTR